MEDRKQEKTAECPVCFHHCRLKEGERGICKARICRDGKSIPENYGMVTALSLDPIEKKPLRRFYPGSRILSVGSYGCSLHCPFCQNWEISLAGGDNNALKRIRKAARYISPEELCRLALDCRARGNIGAAFTYNEALTGYEYVRDAAELIHRAGMKNVLVSNGTAEPWVLEELLPCIDAMNIDLKGSDWFYREILGGSRRQTMNFIEKAAGHCHMEITILVIPGYNDSEEEMRELSSWIEDISPEIPLHVSRYFPANRMLDVPPTPVQTVYHLAEVAKEKLLYVYTGNC